MNKQQLFENIKKKQSLDIACKDAALYETGVSAAYGDKLITLSTCDDSGKNSRMVVVAKRITEPR